MSVQSTELSFSSCQEVLQGTRYCFLPKWALGELTVHWLMWLVYCGGNSICEHTRLINMTL